MLLPEVMMLKLAVRFHGAVVRAWQEIISRGESETAAHVSGRRLVLGGCH